MSLHHATDAAREHADACIDKSCHALALALAAAEHAESDRLLRDGLEAHEPDLTGIPKWSAVSKPGTCEGPLR
jgi:hypothetical protein